MTKNEGFGRCTLASRLNCSFILTGETLSYLRRTLTKIRLSCLHALYLFYEKDADLFLSAEGVKLSLLVFGCSCMITSHIFLLGSSKSKCC